ncbi:MAG: FAD-binding domain-containing protein [Pseudomonadota bacterium]
MFYFNEFKPDWDTLQVVWFKRDLRVKDHRALRAAATRGAILPLYVVEPDLWLQPDMSGRQWAFVAETLTELREALARCGQPLVVRTGDVIDVIRSLHADGHMTALWSHEETGNDWTYQRDRRVAAWCKAQSVPWHQLQNHGVQRRLASRNGWAKQWDRFMAEPVAAAPNLGPLQVDHGALPTAADLRLAPDTCGDRQIGGRAAGLERLDSFLLTRGQSYRRAMSTPIEGAISCSRISPYLAWGALSMREVTQATWARRRTIPQGPTGWAGSIKSFEGRLHWHCHFIQKLEDAPRLEFENLHRSYDGIRSKEPDSVRLTAWEAGETGLPFLDACMRSLRATGWLNFRMRAMVMATASYHLWLDWRAPGCALARLFTDYEPGIHWSQVQMQSGTTGINTPRIYNPVKQGYDQDPTGAFTRRWVPELAAIPDRFLQEPWKADDAGQVIDRMYPAPIVDHLGAARFARKRIWAVRQGVSYRADAAVIADKHGSRKSGIRNRGQRPKKDSAQLQLPLGESGDT